MSDFMDNLGSLVGISIFVSIVVLSIGTFISKKFDGSYFGIAFKVILACCVACGALLMIGSFWQHDAFIILAKAALAITIVISVGCIYRVLFMKK